MQRSLYMERGKLSSSSVTFPLRATRNRELGEFPGRRFSALALIVACWMVSSLPASAAQQVLKGHVPSATKRLAPINRLDSSTRLDLAIGLPLRNREELTNLLQALYQPGNANFRHYLTPDQFASSFGPSREDYQKMIDFAKSHELIVRRTHPNRTLLDVEGSVGDIEKAFHIHMLVYQHPVEARTFFAPDVEPSLDLDTPVLAINGLDNYVRPRPPKHRLGAQVQPAIRPLGGGGGGGGGGRAVQQLDDGKCRHGDQRHELLHDGRRNESSRRAGLGTDAEIPQHRHQPHDHQSCADGD
jgi:hypothetical protein